MAVTVVGGAVTAPGSGVSQIYSALEHLKNIEGGDKLSPTVASAKQYFDVLLRHVHDVDVKVRNLLASEIPLFFHWYPSEASINAIFDFCEDVEAIVRVSAIRGLQKLCEKSPEWVGRVAYVLEQLLVAEDVSELKTVQSALSSIVRIDFSAAIVPLYEILINSDTPAALRQGQLTFLRQNLPGIIKDPSFAANFDHQRLLVTQIRNLILNQSIPLLPLADIEFFFDTIRKIEVTRVDNTQMSSLTSALVESMSSRLKNSSFPPSDTMAYFSTLFQHLGPSSMRSSVTSFKFLKAFFSDIVPLWIPVSSDRTPLPMLQPLRVLYNASESIEPSAAQESLSLLWSLLCSLSSKPKPLSTALQIAEFECVISAFVAVASKSAVAIRNVLGIFTPTGQPSDSSNELAQKKDMFNSRMAFINSEANQQLQMFTSTLNNYKSILGSTKDQKQLSEIKEAIKQLNTPTLALQNIATFGALMLKPKPTFSTSGITMSWRGPGSIKNQQKNKISNKPALQAKKSSAAHDNAHAKPVFTPKKRARKANTFPKTVRSQKKTKSK